LFWRYTRTKDRKEFKEALQVLYKQDKEAGDYINNIPYNI
jgi:hypothetical protein